MKESDIIIEFNKSIDSLRRDMRSDIKDLKSEVVDRVSKIEIRTDSLETFRDNMMGKIAIITVIATSVVSIIVAWLKELVTKN